MTDPADVRGVSQSGVTRLHRAIERGRERDGIALMSHAVVGYPSIEHNEQSIAGLIGGGADLMELQFPFSDPVADGPVLTRANQIAVKNHITVDDGMRLARTVTAEHLSTAFVAMTYANVVYQRGMEVFARELAEAGVSAVIVPDLPPEAGTELWDRCADHGIATILLVTPLTSPDRAAMIAEQATGFVYCVGRPGVSGSETAFDEAMVNFIQRVRDVSNVPVGVGFGVRTPTDIDRLRGVADMAIVCTEAIRRIDADGIESAARYLADLRS